MCVRACHDILAGAKGGQARVRTVESVEVGVVRPVVVVVVVMVVIVVVVVVVVIGIRVRARVEGGVGEVGRGGMFGEERLP